MQELRKDGFDLAESRYRELKPILDEVILFILFAFHFFFLLMNKGLSREPNASLFWCTLQLAILEVEQKAEEEEAETSSRKRGKKKTKHWSTWN